MNNWEYDVLKQAIAHTGVTQRELATICGLSLGKTNAIINELIRKNFIDELFIPTEKYKLLAKSSMPTNALILAAGSGVRMVPINNHVSKGLIEVRGERLVERLICQLHEKDIHDITIVVGFMKEKYDYLIDKFGVKLCVNTQYSTKNNLVSLACVKEKICDTYIIPCDIFCTQNPFDKIEFYSWYMMSSKSDNCNKLRINRSQEIVKAKKGEKTNAMLGIAYLTRDTSNKVREMLEVFANDAIHDNAFWEDTLYNANKLIIAPKLVLESDCFEINTYEQLRELDENSKNLDSQILELVATVLNVKKANVCNIQTLKKGMTNRSFMCSCGQKKYIVRIPGEGTDLLINRMQEYQVYKILEPYDITDKVVYMNPKSGIKITEFIENSKNCNAFDDKEVKQVMMFLKAFHQKNLQVEHTFNPFERIEYYERLWLTKQSVYSDYDETKRKIFNLKEFVDAQEKQWTLCHIDSVADNFLLVPNEIKDNDSNIFLIDWEYAGMQDPHIDIALFAIYSMMDMQQIEQLIDSYFNDENCSELQRLKIYCYIAICGLLWSNWCEYKQQLGVEFGEYSLAQYRYAKNYYELFMQKYKQCYSGKNL